jgi:hypothetical protein
MCVWLAISSAPVVWAAGQFKGEALVTPDQWRQLRERILAVDTPVIVPPELTRHMGHNPSKGPAFAKGLRLDREHKKYSAYVVLDSAPGDVYFEVQKPDATYVHLTDSRLTLRVALRRTKSGTLPVAGEQAAETYQECLRVWVDSLSAAKR